MNKIRSYFLDLFEGEETFKKNAQIVFWSNFIGTIILMVPVVGLLTLKHFMGL